MGMGAADRPTTIERNGLNDPALQLSDAQKAQIDKIVDGYVAEQKSGAREVSDGAGHAAGPGRDDRHARGA